MAGIIGVMLNRIADWFKRVVDADRPFIDDYVATLDDPIAQATEWSPLSQGGSSFCTHRLVELSGGRAEFRPTAMARLFPVVFLIFAAAALGWSAYSAVTPAVDRWESTAMLGLIGSVLLGVGIWFYRRMTGRAVFDGGSGWFWRGTPPDGSGAHDRERAVELERVYALQIVSEWVQSDNSSFMSYEINLVLDDGSRVHVVDHGKIDFMRKDAARLGDLLSVPVWDIA